MEKGILLTELVLDTGLILMGGMARTLIQERSLTMSLNSMIKVVGMGLI
jgi:hypothetical protein